MKKFRKLFLSLIIMFVCIFGIKYNVCAEEQEENYRIDVVAETGKAGCVLRMSLEGFDKAKAIEKGYSYYVKFVKNKNDKPVLSETLDELEEVSDEPFGSYYSVGLAHNEQQDSYKSSIHIEYDWYMVDGYTEAYIVKCARNSETPKLECEVLENPVTVEKKELPSLSQRYKYYLFSDDNELNVFPYFPYLSGENGSHELNVKIGLINDDQLLKRISKNEPGSYETLISYAKTNDGTVYSFSDKVNYNIDTSGFEVVNGSYYYIYAYYTNTDGLYRNLDDVTVAMGDHDMLVNDVVWNFDESLWDKYVEEYKKTDIIKGYTDKNATVDIESTSTTLNSVIENEDVKLIGNFTYKDGIVSYEVLDDEEVTFETIRNEGILIENAIVALANLKGYDANKLKTWLYENEGNLSLEKDGVEYTLENYIKNDEKGSTTVLKKVKSFKFKLDSGTNVNSNITSDLNAIKPDEGKTENPKTGIDLGYKILLGAIVVGGVLYTSIKRRSKFPKHN